MERAMDILSYVPQVNIMAQLFCLVIILCAVLVFVDID